MWIRTNWQTLIHKVELYLGPLLRVNRYELRFRLILQPTSYFQKLEIGTHITWGSSILTMESVCGKENNLKICYFFFGSNWNFVRRGNLLVGFECRGQMQLIGKSFDMFIKMSQISDHSVFFYESYANKHSICVYNSEVYECCELFSPFE